MPEPTTAWDLRGLLTTANPGGVSNGCECPSPFRPARYHRCKSSECCTNRGPLIALEFSCAEISEWRREDDLGYARVSTDGQSLESQDASLRAAGAERIYAEKVSGAVTDRKALAKAIASLHEGDTLLVCRLDRLARSTRDLLNVLAQVSEKGAGFRSLADPMIDTTSPHGKLILAVLGALAEFERSMILATTSEGRARAQARGIRFGRKPKLSQFQIAEALRRRAEGEALADIGRSYGVSHSTISRL
jgi:DNA invertase Pin-like site-specific DNA recombinase